MKDDLFVRPEVFSSMSRDFQCLEWWYSYTALGRNLAECWFSTDNITSALLGSICKKAGFADINIQNFEHAIKVYQGYNKHALHYSARVTWNELERKARAEEQDVLRRSRESCKMYYRGYSENYALGEVC